MCPTVLELLERLSNLEQLSPPLEIEVLIEHSPTNTPIGLMSLSGIDYFNSKAEFSIGFVRGLGTRCVLEAIHFAFEQAFAVLKLRKLIFYVAEGNSSALRLLSHSPVIQEGFLRQELQFASGATMDLYRFALFASDWENSSLRLRLQQLTPVSP
jgi:RimJ/RimL family protein N-acetyltransferase